MGYVRYSLMTVVLIAITVQFVLGGPWFWAGFLLAVVFVSVTDELLGSTRVAYRNLSRLYMDGVLFATLPFMLLLAALLATYLSGFDPFGLIGLLGAGGIDMAARRAETTALHLAGGVLTLGIIAGSAGVNVAHELMHRIHSKPDVVVSRWLLAFTCDTTFAIEHVFGHHRHVATDRDPATARRGEGLFAFLVRSTLGQLRGAFEIEARRLNNRGARVWSIGNRAARGQLMSLLLLAAFIYAAGVAGAIAFLCIAAVGKTHLEAVNYIEHYGLVRVPGEKVAARHSWDSYRKVSSFLLYNLTRHADHHLDAQKPYWSLEARDDAPKMPYGYMSMMLIALVPPLWRHVMHPRLAGWDREFASAEERELLRGRGLLLAG
ncbi:MAG: alkane 1-monooxygenase [Pseudomonadota bacterium]